MTSPSTNNATRPSPAAIASSKAHHRTAPHHMAIIMDGNGRWAEERGLPRSEGHRAGYENIRGVVEQLGRAGVRYVTLFAFSTENWDRPSEEVSSILALASEVIKVETKELHRKNVRILHVGRSDRLPAELQSEIVQAMELTRENTGLTLCVAFDYGGRTEIVQAVRSIVEEGLPSEEVTEESFASRLLTREIPDPDLIIRTGGEFRISNFLLWQSAYAEFYSAPVNWPDFKDSRIDCALDEYGRRERRFGRVR